MLMSIFLQLIIFFVFLAVIWPAVKKEKWKEKFIDNRHARSILIVFILILLFVMAISVFFDTFYPLERLK